MTFQEAQKHLNNVLKELKQKYESKNSLNRFEERFDSSVFVSKVEDNYIYIALKDELTKFYVQKFDLSFMNDVLDEITKEKTRFKLLTASEAAEIKAEEDKPFFIKHVDNKSFRKMRGLYRFENFVVGESNRFSYLSACKTAESPGEVLNPLYIFGSVGLGKTHLMQAIGHYVLDNSIESNVVYTTAQQLCDDYFAYTRDLKAGNSNNLSSFYVRYRGADVLLVDDIQFLEKKNLTQEEFFKLFEYLYERNKQIVITSDKKASELQLMARLKSRFSQGLCVDIKAPDKSLRVKILEKKLLFFQNANEVPKECLELIADLIYDNVRSLEGAINRFINYCVSMNLPFTIDNVYASLDGVIPNASSGVVIDNAINDLKDEVCSYFSVTNEDLLSKSRKAKLVYARNICFYIIRKEFGYTFDKIGHIFGGKDHTSVMYGFEKISDALEDKKTKTDVQYILKKLRK